MIAMSCRISGGDYDGAGLATAALKERLARAGVSAASMRRAMIASYEAEMNVVIHARMGTLWARLDNCRLDLEVSDEGPGIPDVASAMKEGWSTASERARQMGFGAGMGLPNIRRNSDLFEIETRVGKGTRIRATILLDSPGAGAVVDTAAGPAMPLAVQPGRCRLCMRCLRVCPTGALRIRAAGPRVLGELCIGCAACAAECPQGVYGIDEQVSDDMNAPGLAPAAHRPAADLGVTPDAVLLVPLGFLAGFPVAEAPGRVLAALRRLGWSTVRLTEEWGAALRSGCLSALGAGSWCGPLPLIPPLCPAVIALVESRYPSLIPNLGAWLSPVEAAGEEFPLQSVVLAAACPAQYAAAGKASLTGRLSVVAPGRLAETVRPLLAGGAGPGAGPTGSAAPGGPVPISPSPEAGEVTAFGGRQVNRVLAEAEAGRLAGVSLLSLYLCDGGCPGSPYLTKDPCLSAARWRAYQQATESSPARPARQAGPEPGPVARAHPYAQRPGLRLHGEMAKAIELLARIDACTRSLPGRDCAACGSPSCAAFAEDVVLGRAGGSSCPHREESR